MNECFGCGQNHSGQEQCDTTPGDRAIPVIGFALIPLLMIAAIINRLGQEAGAW